MKRKIVSAIKKPIEIFLKTEASSGIFLAICALIAMALANSPWAPQYFNLLLFKIAGLNIQQWINDAFMAIFFFAIGMEIKKELIVGELRSPQQAALPIAAALGGMIFPALIYHFFNQQGPNAHGWGIPMATDIAFALGILTLFGKRVPLSLKIFLLAIAIVDDLGAILVIAFFYTSKINGQGLGIAALFIGLMILIKAMGVRSYLAYIIFGSIAWLGVLLSGVHATIAGVVIGLITPLTYPSRNGSNKTYSPLDYLVNKLHPWVSYGIMPIFALANSGINITGADLSQLIQNPIHQGVAIGLVIGKPIGIILFSALANGKTL
jgi:NhaA family Na+:H+ antiporter